jgi:hypothetical protein
MVNVLRKVFGPRAGRWWETGKKYTVRNFMFELLTKYSAVLFG